MGTRTIMLTETGEREREREGRLEPEGRRKVQVSGGVSKQGVAVID
jgi:hypothetical protein